MALLDNELARREREQLLLRGTPLRVRWELAEMPAGDGYALNGVFVCSVRPVADRTERKMLEEVLMGGRATLTGEQVASHFSSALRSAAANAARGQAAAVWLADEKSRQPMVAALKNAAEAVAFACGLEILPPFQLDLQSPTFERQRLREMQQALEQKQAAGQVEHFQRAAELLKQFQTLRASAPELSPGRVLAQMGSGDRGSVLQTLLMASAARQPARRLWAVAGPYLVGIDTPGNEQGRITAKANLVSLPTTLGPLRSVRAADIEGRRALLVGARSGFVLVDPEQLGEPKLFHDAAVETQHGFNRVIYWPSRRQFCGTHADAGIVCWDAAAPASPQASMRTLEIAPDLVDVSSAAMNSMAINSSASFAGSGVAGGASGPRNLTVLDDQTLLFSLGRALFTWDGANAEALPIEPIGEIISILPEDGQLHCICEDGTIGVLDRATRRWTGRERRAGRIRAAGALPWLDTTRVLLAADEGPIQCVGPDDPLVTQYASAYRGLRMVVGSAEVVAASSPDRQRVVLWNSWDGRQPAGELFITSLTRHRITDLAFG